jgi:hypothetical protein
VALVRCWSAPPQGDRCFVENQHYPPALLLVVVSGIDGRLLTDAALMSERTLSAAALVACAAAYGD